MDFINLLIKSMLITPPPGVQTLNKPNRPYHSVPADDGPAPAVTLLSITSRRVTLQRPWPKAYFKRKKMARMVADGGGGGGRGRDPQKR